MPLRLFTPKKSAAGMLTVSLLTVVFLLVVGSTQPGVAQNQPLLNIFKNYFVTGDYVVGGWVEASSANGFATGTISIPDCRQAQFMSQACPPPPPAGAD